MDHSDDDVPASPDKRRVTPIRVVNLASLQDIKIVRNDMPMRQSRRKSVHQVRTTQDDQLEFIESRIELNNDTSSSNSTIASSSNSVTATRKSYPSSSNLKRSAASKVRINGTRPNAELMKRVAMLRVCAEYMLNELQVKNVEFGENQSLEMLKAQYLRNVRRKY